MPVTFRYKRAGPGLTKHIARNHNLTDKSIYSDKCISEKKIKTKTLINTDRDYLAEIKTYMYGTDQLQLHSVIYTLERKDRKSLRAFIEKKAIVTFH